MRILTEKEIEEYNYQREELSAQYKRKELKTKIAYENQMDAALCIAENFANGKVAQTLVAQPGAGKTGTFLYVAYLMCIHPDENAIIPDNNVYILTGMCDIDWEKQTKNNMLPKFEKNVYHSGQLKNITDIRKNSLIIIDECHIASEYFHRLGTKLKELNLLDLNYLIENNIKILTVSATPDKTLLDLERWKDEELNKYHSKVILSSSPIYKGFKYFKDKDMLRQSFKLKDNVDNFIQPILRSWKNTPKYHLIRIKDSNIRNEIESLAEDYGWDIKYHDSEERAKNKKNNEIDIDTLMETAPNKHTFILIKNMWRAGKRLTKDHVGIVYETNTSDVSVTIQGLLGRFCCNDEKDFQCIFYCNLKAVDEYLDLITKDFNYMNTAIKVSDKTTFAHPSIVEGCTYDSEEDKLIKDKEYNYKTVPIIVDITKEEIQEIEKKKKNRKYDKNHIYELVKNNINDDTYNIENLLQVSCPKKNIEKKDDSYNKNIVKYIEASKENKREKPKDILKNGWELKKCWEIFIDMYEYKLVILRWNYTN